MRLEIFSQIIPTLLILSSRQVVTESGPASMHKHACCTLLNTTCISCIWHRFPTIPPDLDNFHSIVKMIGSIMELFANAAPIGSLIDVTSCKTEQGKDPNSNVAPFGSLMDTSMPGQGNVHTCAQLS
jgi:hypothetical protein